MAVGTAALIIILSVYNGFDSLVRSMLGSIEPDLLVQPASGKAFVPEGDAYDWLYGHPDVESVCTVIEENVFISYGGSQGTAAVKGVDSIYEEESPLRNHLREGEFRLHRGDVPLACVGAGLASRMDISPRFVSPVTMYFPSRKGNVSLVNPAASIREVNVYPSGVFSVNNDIDAEYMIVPADAMRRLLEYEDEVSGVEIRLRDGISAKAAAAVKDELSERLGEGFTVKDRFRQNEALYKMMKHEKISIFLILMFVVIIIAFNILGSLTMLMIDKREDIGTVRSMGATDSTIRRIFILEGWMISLLGLAAGLAAGAAFVLLQQRFGFIRMPGNFVIQAYPVILTWQDTIMTATGVAVIGYLAALMPAVGQISRLHE